MGVSGPQTGKQRQQNHVVLCTGEIWESLKPGTREKNPLQPNASSLDGAPSGKANHMAEAALPTTPGSELFSLSLLMQSPQSALGWMVIFVLPEAPELYQ